MKRVLAAAPLLLLLISATSYAALIPELEAIAPSASGTGFTYFYSLDLAAGTKLDTSRPFDQAFVIYDFAGLINGTIGSGSGNWDISVVNSGPLISPEVQAEPGDNPSLPNLVFRYIGPVILGPQTDFDAVFADSTFSLAILDRYQGQGTKVVAPPDPANENNTATGTDGNVGVPAIPEPATMGLMGSGLLGLVLLARRTRK
jgi:hypothetical protein